MEEANRRKMGFHNTLLGVASHNSFRCILNPYGIEKLMVDDALIELAKLYKVFKDGRREQDK